MNSNLQVFEYVILLSCASAANISCDVCESKVCGRFGGVSGEHVPAGQVFQEHRERATIFSTRVHTLLILCRRPGSNSASGPIRRAVLRGRPPSHRRGVRQPARNAHGAHAATHAQGGQPSGSCLPLLGKEGEKTG